MFCGRKTNSMTNDLHQQTLIIVYKNRDLSFNIKTLSIELFKVKECLFEKQQIVN